MADYSESGISESFVSFQSLTYKIAIVFEKLREMTNGDFEAFIEFFVNNLLWGYFDMKDESYNMFGNSTFFIPMKKSHTLFASTNIERYPIVDKHGNVCSQ